MLWVRLMEQHAADPVALQWLPALACWLSDSASRSSASERSEGASHSHESASQALDPAHQAAEAGEEAVREHVANMEAQPPLREAGHLSHRHAHEAKRLPEAARRGQAGAGSPVSRPSPRRDNGGGQSALNRSVEEALSLQEAATRIGYGAGALPLWQAFLQRFFRHRVRFWPLHFLHGPPWLTCLQVCLLLPYQLPACGG